MKNIFKLFSLVILLSVALVSCEEEADWFSDYNGDGAAYVQFADTDWDFGLFLDAAGTPVTEATFPIYVKIVGPAQASDVSVVLKVTESTGAAGEWSLSSLTATIPAGELSGSVMITIDKDAPVIDSTYTIELSLEAGSSLPVYGNVASTASVTVMKGLSCALDYTMSNGDFYYKTIWDYEPNPAAVVTADADKAMLTIVTTWDEMGPTTITLDVGDEVATNLFDLSSDNQMDVWSGSLEGWGLGADSDFNFEDFNDTYADAGIKSCTGEFSFSATPTLDDNTNGGSYWWGGEFIFEFVPGAPGQAAVTTVTPVGGFTPKLQRR